MATDPRAIVIAEMRKQTALLDRIANALAPPIVDLDGPHGDPIVKAKDPKNWAGEPQHGKRFSECPPAYLDQIAERLEFFASREEDPKKAGYNRLDASRARGWAARLRSGWVPPVAQRVDETQGEPSW